MKKFLTTIVTCLVLTHGVYSQTEKEQILKIDKAKLEIINNLNSYQKIEKYKDDISYKYVFLKDKELKLITLKTNDKNIEKRVSWYFVNEQLIFSEQIWINKESNEIINHEKFYTNNGNLIAWIKTDNTTEDTSSENFKYIDKELSAYAVKLQTESLK